MRQQVMTLSLALPRLIARPGLLKLAAALFFVSALLFQLYPTFDAYFMADDFGWIRFARSHDNVLEAAMRPSLGDWTTPLSNVFFWLLFKFFHLEPRGYFVAIALLHLLNGWLVYRLVAIMTRRKVIGLGAAFIFTLHFIHFSDWGALVWISAFVQVVVASFYLASLLLFIHYARSGQRHYYVAALVCFALALAAKETAASLPLLLAAVCVLGLLPVERRWQQLVPLLAPFFLVLAAYLLYKVAFQQTSSRYLEERLYDVGWHMLWNWKYFSNLVMPNPDSPPVRSFILRTFPLWMVTLAEVAVLLSRVLLLLAGVLLWWRGPKHARLWLLLAVIAYLPFIAFTGGFAGASRYFYLPAVAFSALLADGLWRLWDRLRARQGTAASALVVGLLLVSFWAYSLVPARSWQKQMQANSHVNRQLISVLDEHIRDTAGVPAPDVYLKGFSTEEFQRLQVIVRLVYGADAIRLTERDDAIDLPDESLVLVYEKNRVTRWHPGFPWPRS
jgi:hypothetical protein